MCNTRHHIFQILFIVTLTCCHLINDTNAYCSLDKMKKYAMEACEHLFLQADAREKRSPSYHDNLIESDYAKIYDDKYYTTIARSIYPRGGYLKVGREHYHKLSQVDVYPKYKAKKIHREKDRYNNSHEKERFKRENTPNYSNIPYCCYNRCEEDFFC